MEEFDGNKVLNGDSAIDQDIFELGVEQEIADLDEEDQVQIATNLIEASDEEANEELFEAIVLNQESETRNKFSGTKTGEWSRDVRFDCDNIHNLISEFVGFIDKNEFKKISSRIICCYDFDAVAAGLVYAYVDSSCLVKPETLPSRRKYFNKWPDDHKFCEAFEVFSNRWIDFGLHRGHASAAANWVGNMDLFQASQNFTQFFAQYTWFNMAVNLVHEKLFRKIIQICGSAIMAHGAVYDRDIDGNMLDTIQHYNGKLKIASLFYVVLLLKDTSGQLFRMTFILSHKQFESIDGSIRNSLYDKNKLNALGVKDAFQYDSDAIELTSSNITAHMPWFNQIRQEAIAETKRSITRFGSENRHPLGVECSGYGDVECHATFENTSQMNSGPTGEFYCNACYKRWQTASYFRGPRMFKSLPIGVECFGYGDVKCHATIESASHMHFGPTGEFYCDACYWRWQSSSLVSNKAVGVKPGRVYGRIPIGVECSGYGDVKCHATFESASHMCFGPTGEFYCNACYMRWTNSSLVSNKAVGVTPGRVYAHIPIGVECSGYGDVKCHATFESASRMCFGPTGEFYCNACYMRWTKS